MATFLDAEAFRFHLLTSSRTARTAQAYIDAVAAFNAWCQERGILPAPANRSDVQAYLAHALTRLARNTVATRLAALRAYFEWRDRPEVTAGLKIKREKVAPERPFSDSEISRLQLAAASPRGRAMLTVVLECGARISELVAMRCEDIDVEAGQLVLRGKGEKQRWARLTPAAAEALSPFLRRSGPVWIAEDGEPVTAPEAKAWLWRLAQRAGVKAHWHRFRTTFASRFLKQTHDIDSLRVLLGHADTRTTQHYAEYEAVERAMDQMRKMRPE